MGQNCEAAREKATCSQSLGPMQCSYDVPKFQALENRTRLFSKAWKMIGLFNHGPDNDGAILNAGVITLEIDWAGLEFVGS